MRIIKLKKITSIIRKLQEIYIDSQDLYKLVFYLNNNYIVLLYKFTHKLQILILKNKNKVFDIFKLLFSRIELMKVNSIIYKFIEKKCSLILFFKAFAKKRDKDQIYCIIYIKKRYSRTLLENIYIDKRHTTY